MTTDPLQMHNLLSPNTTSATNECPTGLSYSIPRLQSRLDALLLVLKSCTASSCREPFKQLHPDGSVANLADAMDERYDGFYEELEKVHFGRCELGYLIGAEGVQWEVVI